MAIHAIVLQAENDKVIKRIEKHYPDYLSVNNICFLVRTTEISEKVATKAGIKGDDRVEDSSGAVFRLNGAYSGHASRDLWEWLSIEDANPPARSGSN